MVGTSVLVYVTVGIISLYNDKANPGAPTNVTCVVRTANPEQDVDKIYLTRGGNSAKQYKPIEVKKSEKSNLTAIFHLERGLAEGEKYRCNIGDDDGQVVSKNAISLLYKLPVLTRPLQVHPTEPMYPYLSLVMSIWDPSKGDLGDGPVTSYIIKGCLHTEKQSCNDTEDSSAYRFLMEAPDYFSGLNISAIPVKPGLNPVPGSHYSLIYKARRPGYWGIGPASKLLTVRIPCIKPLAPPRLHRNNYTMQLVGEMKLINVTISWELPHAVEQFHGCNNVSDITVKLVEEDGSETSAIVVGHDITSLSTIVKPYTQYSVHLSYTNNEGYTSDEDNMKLNKTLPALPDACEITDIYMIGRNSAFVQWNTTEFPNGEILQYQVLIKQPDVSDYTEACNASAPYESCYVTGLSADTNYTFIVRARNSVGFGDSSSGWEFTSTLGVPGPVEAFINISKTENSIELSWMKSMSDDDGTSLKNYQLVVRSDNGNSKTTYSIGADTAKALFKFNVTNLEHSTKYECQVVACSKSNYCRPMEENKYLVVYTDPADPPVPTLPKFAEKENTDTSVALEITPSQGCSLYRVVVMEIMTLSKRSVSADQPSSDIKVKRCGKCCDGTCYIAGELRADQLPMTFNIGDNNSYNGYHNPPLVTGKKYQIWYGAGNAVDGLEKFNYVSLDEPVVAREYVQERSTTMASATLIGIIVGVCTCTVVMIVLAMVFVRHKRNKKFRFRTPDSEKVLELNENGTLLTNGTYQRGDAVSVDSLDMSKQPNGEPVYDNVRLKQYPIMVEELRQYIELKSSDEGFKKEYNRIPWGLKFSHEIAKLPDNKHKNRYGNIIAYDHSRVVLRGKHPEQDTDYINASYIDGYTTPKEYIATQGPTKFTVNDLWHMAWQERTAIIVMVTNTVEQTRHKCEQYWPELESVQYGNVKVTLSNTKSLAHYKIRTFTMEQEDEIRNIKQFHFTAWPDHGTPTHATTLLSFLKRVRQQKTPDDGPIICHCSAGVGRSGTFIALDSLIQQAESENKVDVYGYVSQMRKQRCNMIQTLDQYIFLHDAILEASEGFDTAISLSDFKSEFDKIKQGQSKGKSQLDTLYLKLQDLLYVDRNTHATSKENQPKNRSATVIPFNDRRVMLINMPSDYINATYVDDHRKRSALIATQHPLNSTVEEFWKMVQTQKPFSVVTLCAASAVADCTDKKALPKFWPTPECRTKEFTTVSVELLDEAELDQIPSVTKQSLTVTCKNQAMFQSKPADVDHYICNFWPSQKSLPTDTDSFVKLVAMLERRKLENDDRQIVVNCFDGAKQSGLYIACHSLLQQILLDSEVDIPETVKLIRNDQPMFIPHVDQFRFCYEFVSQCVDNSNQDSAVFTCL